MSAHSTPKDQGRVFVAAKAAKGPPKPARTDEEIRADMKASVRRNVKALQVLAKL